MLELRTKVGLSQADMLLVCSAVQTAILEEVFKALGWNQSDAIFHGGSSIRLGHGSPRFSEDIDMMVAGPRLAVLEAAADGIVAAVRRRIERATPGATITFKWAPERPGRDRMDTWDLRWSHPMRHGVAKVKAEFYAVDPDLLPLYDTVMVTPGATVGLRTRTPIPFASLLGLWGDKVKAIASRPIFKMRDAHDLGLISRVFDMGCRPADESLRNAAILSGRIYEKDAEDTMRGIRLRLEDGTVDGETGFITDMQRWFDEATHEALVTSGLLHDCWCRCWDEMRIAHDLLANPQPEYLISGSM
jgi:hypothetical protein